jgi:hypothetical protein
MSNTIKTKIDGVEVELTRLADSGNIFFATRIGRNGKATKAHRPAKRNSDGSFSFAHPRWIY